MADCVGPLYVAGELVGRLADSTRSRPRVQSDLTDGAGCRWMSCCRTAMSAPTASVGGSAAYRFVRAQIGCGGVIQLIELFEQAPLF